MAHLVRCDALVAEAVLEANHIFDPALGIELSYRACGGPVTAHSIEVFVVASDSLPDSGFAVAPDQCRNIFLGDNTKHAVRDSFGTASSMTMDISTVNALALLLLHETGHIALRQASVVESLPKRPFEMAADKAEEADADAFAAQQLGRALHAPNTSHYSDIVAVNLLLADVSWNLQEKRLSEHFGSSLSPPTFVEKQGAHPNLELRFLLMNYYLHPSSTQLELIRSFLFHRNEPQPNVLFSK